MKTSLDERGEIEEAIESVSLPENIILVHDADGISFRIILRAFSERELIEARLSDRDYNRLPSPFLYAELHNGGVVENQNFSRRLRDLTLRARSHLRSCEIATRAGLLDVRMERSFPILICGINQDMHPYGSPDLYSRISACVIEYRSLYEE